MQEGSKVALPAKSTLYYRMRTTSHKPPYLRLSSYYFFFFAALGVFAPYWSVYLKEGLSYNAIQIGQVMAVFMATKLIAPFLWGWLADRVQRRLSLVRLASFLTLLFLLGVYIDTNFVWILLIVGLFGFFWRATRNARWKRWINGISTWQGSWMK